VLDAATVAELDQASAWGTGAQGAEAAR
jgi:hypothetical protein